MWWFRSRRWLLAHCPNDEAALLKVGVDRWLCPACGYMRLSCPIPHADLRAQTTSDLLPD
jgi:hypothetical protein